jgi:hypothetical protein
MGTEASGGIARSGARGREDGPKQTASAERGKVRGRGSVLTTPPPLLRCAAAFAGQASATAMLTECARVLATGGVLFSITDDPPELRTDLFLGELQVRSSVLALLRCYGALPVFVGPASLPYRHSGIPSLIQCSPSP